MKNQFAGPRFNVPVFLVLSLIHWPLASPKVLQEANSAECIVDTETGMCQTGSSKMQGNEEQNETNSPLQGDQHESCLSWAEMGECDVNPR